MLVGFLGSTLGLMRDVCTRHRKGEIKHMQVGCQPHSQSEDLRKASMHSAI